MLSVLLCVPGRAGPQTGHRVQWSGLNGFSSNHLRAWSPYPDDAVQLSHSCLLSCPLYLSPGNRTASTLGAWDEHLFACCLHDLEACLVSYLLPKDVRSARPCFLGFMEIMGLLERVTPGVGVRSADLAFSLIYCNRQNEKQVIWFHFIFWDDVMRSRLTVYLKVTLNFWPTCFQFPSAGMADVYYHTWFMVYLSIH